MKHDSDVPRKEAFGSGWIIGLLIALVECFSARNAVFSDPEVRGVAALMLGLSPLLTGSLAWCLVQIPQVRTRGRFAGILLFLVLAPWLLSLVFPRVLNVLFMQTNRWPRAAGVVFLALLVAREVSRRPALLYRMAPRRVGLLALAFLPFCYGLVHVLPNATSQSHTPFRETGAEHPNLLLITIDTLRKDELACYGGPPGNTPCIDSLAASGRVFSKATTCSPWTLASFANIMTGHYPSTTGVFTGRNRLASQFKTLAELLSERGYYTHAIVTNIWLRPEFGLHQGFHVFDHRAPEEPNKDLNRFFGYRLFRLTQHLRRAGAVAPLESAEDVAQQTSRFLGGSVPTPFFLWLHFNDVHDPYRPPPEYVPAPAGSYRGPFRNTSGSMMTLRQGGRLSQDDRQRIRALYRGEIRYVDTQIGRILSALRAAGLNDSTVVVLTSDHGEEFWEHDNVMHGHTLYGELLDIPLLVVEAAVQRAGDRDTRACSLVDVVPTVFDALGLIQPADLAGRSLLQPALVEDDAQYGEALQFYRELKSITRDGWKLIQSPESGPVSLFRLTVDPSEQVNEKDRFPEIVESLSQQLGAHLTACRERADRLSIRREATTISLSPKLRAELRAQGYIE